MSNLNPGLNRTSHITFKLKYFALRFVALIFRTSSRLHKGDACVLLAGCLDGWTAGCSVKSCKSTGSATRLFKAAFNVLYARGGLVV
jgi:hypothetical protein